MPRNLENVSTIQQRIATAAQRSPKIAFTSLAHYIDLEWLTEAFHRTRKDGAAGIDDVTGKQYAENLQENLQNLLDRLKSGTYKAPPVKRKHIPKGTSGETRPIGIPAFEDKIVQRAVVMLLEPIYEYDFYDGSFGFRPKRSAHQALAAVWDATMEVKGGWVLEVDIRKFFDTIDHRQLQEFVSQRIRDGVIRRLIGKWLNAGVMEDGNISYSDEGTPQACSRTVGKAQGEGERPLRLLRDHGKYPTSRRVSPFGPPSVETLAQTRSHPSPVRRTTRRSGKFGR